MNWLCWACFAVIIVCGLLGLKNGLLKTIVSMASLLIVLLVTTILTPPIGDFLSENTRWPEVIQESLKESLFEELDHRVEQSMEAQSDYIDQLPLPQILKDKLIDNNKQEVYQQFDVSAFSDYISAYLTKGIIRGITFIVAFLLAQIFMKVLLFAVDVLAELPLVGSVDRLLGLAIGIVQGLFWVSVVFFIVVLCCDTKWGNAWQAMILSNPILAWIYNKNILITIVMNVIS